MGIKDWFNSQMFGSKIIQTLGSVKGQDRSLVRVELKVHILAGKDLQSPRLIGMEIVAKSILSYRMTPITLTRDEGRQLIDLLNSAIR